jgi:hypothetical protein
MGLTERESKTGCRGRGRTWTREIEVVEDFEDEAVVDEAGGDDVLARDIVVQTMEL